MIISIVGLSNSGKGYISNYLKELNPNILHIDIDKIGHSIYENSVVLEEMINAFGNQIITEGKIDRHKLSKIVFNSSQAMQKLEDITWKYMEQEIDRIINDNPNRIILLDWQLLPKTKYFKKSSLKILVTASYKTRLYRAMSRDNITEDKFKERESASLSFNTEDFDYVIQNEELKETKKKVMMIYDKSIIHR